MAEKVELNANDAMVLLQMLRHKLYPDPMSNYNYGVNELILGRKNWDAYNAIYLRVFDALKPAAPTLQHPPHATMMGWGD